MGARLVVVCEGEHDRPMVYLHWGGEYQEQIRQTLDEFISAVTNLADPRFHDPVYLAAKLVVWEARQSQRGDNVLNFLSVGVVNDESWGDGVAVIDCVKGDGSYKITKAIDLEVPA